jgi:hypothetical protein
MTRANTAERDAAVTFAFQRHRIVTFEFSDLNQALDLMPVRAVD